jgi:hypothetical protein
MNPWVLGALLVAGAGAPAAAAPARKDAFLEDRAGIIAVAVERVRRAPDDAGRAVKAGENRLRRLHENYQVAKSTPPTSLEKDVRELSAAATRMRLERSRGRTPAADPRVDDLIRRHWETYQARVQLLFDDIPYKRKSGVSEASLYWQALKDHEIMASDLVEALAYNPPPGESGAQEAADRDRWELLKKLEDPARVGALSGCVVAPGEHSLPHAFDVGPFYRAAGILPGTAPLQKGAFRVPPGCRTVTRRDSGQKLILRASSGRGVIRIGAQHKPLAYDYVVVPPEAPYIIENHGRGEPLEIDYIAIQP